MFWVGWADGRNGSGRVRLGTKLEIADSEHCAVLDETISEHAVVIHKIISGRCVILYK